MSFLNRFGWGLIFFGIVTLVAISFGYAPRKLANLDPGQIQVAGGVFLVGGIVCLVIDSGPRARRVAGIVLTSLLALVVLAGAAAFALPWLRTRTAPPVPPPVQRPVPPSPPAAAGAPPESRVATAPRPSLPAGYAQDTAEYYREKRQLESSLGRETLWEIVVHLGPAEAPAELPRRLSALAGNGRGGRALVTRTGGIVHACIAPLGNGDPLEAELRALFPGAEVRRIPQVRNFIVFAQQGGPSTNR